MHVVTSETKEVLGELAWYLLGETMELQTELRDTVMQSLAGCLSLISVL